MVNSTPVLLAYSLNGDGHGTALEGAKISKQLQDDAPAWVHLDALHPNARSWLEQEVSYLDSYIIDALLAEETRPRMLQIGDGVLLILRGVNLNDDAQPEDMVSIRLWVDAHRIISVRRRKLKAISDIEEKLKSGNGPQNAGDFTTLLVARLFARMEPALSQLDDTTDDLEACLLEHADATLREQIVGVRKQAIIFRRYMAPQRDAIGQLRMSDISWLAEQNKRHLQESYNQITRYVEDLDAIRERAQIVKDELANMLADKLNKNMYVLSVIAAIFLPLGFLTGLLGVNIGGIPGTQAPYAFAGFCLILVVLVAIQILIFKKLRWF